MKRKGFTVMEAMIVTAIIGILAAVALPNFYAEVEEAKNEVARQEEQKKERIFYSHSVSIAQKLYVEAQDTAFEGPYSGWKVVVEERMRGTLTEFVIYTDGKEPNVKAGDKLYMYLTYEPLDLNKMVTGEAEVLE